MERVRFAKDHITRALTAIERLDPDSLTDGIRVLELEDQVKELRDQTERWRISYERTAALLDGTPDAKKRDQEFREWIAKA